MRASRQGKTINNVRRSLCPLLVAALLCISTTRATSFSTDQSDIYNALNESGWAVEFIHRGSTIFAVLYVYDESNNPVWYSATLEFVQAGFGSLTWSGDLYATKGPWFGTAPFDSSQVTLRKVGSMTWLAQTPTSGSLSYGIDGVQVTKALSRVLIRYDDFSGHYSGGIHEVVTGAGCGLTGTMEKPGFIYVTQNGQAVTVQILALDSPASCTYLGTSTQAGQMGSVSGTFTCNTGARGSFSFFEMQVNQSGITARTALTYTAPVGCKSTGWFGGFRGTTF